MRYLCFYAFILPLPPPPPVPPARYNSDRREESDTYASEAWPRVNPMFELVVQPGRYIGVSSPPLPPRSIYLIGRRLD